MRSEPGVEHHSPGRSHRKGADGEGVQFGTRGVVLKESASELLFRPPRYEPQSTLRKGARADAVHVLPKED